VFEVQGRTNGDGNEKNTEEKVKDRQSRRVYFVRGFSCFRSAKKEIQPWIFVFRHMTDQKKGEEQKGVN
jgi:hypothetical protein